MAERYLPVELQDKDGNVMYPHSEADVIWMQDGKNVQQVLGELAMLLAGIDGVSSMTNLDDATKLATAKAVASLNTLLDTLNRNLGGFTPVISETGEITGYKTERGADTVFPFKGELRYSSEQTTIDSDGIAIVSLACHFADGNSAGTNRAFPTVNGSVPANKTQIADYSKLIHDNTSYNHIFVTVWTVPVKKGDVIWHENATMFLLAYN